MRNKSALLFATLTCVTMTTAPLAGCSIPNLESSTNNSQTTKTQAIQEIQTFVNQKQNLTEQLWNLQNQKTMALNQSNFKKLSQIKAPLFKTQTQLTKLTNKIIILNKVLRHHYHQAVLDNEQVIDTWKLLKTDDSDSNHQRAHILINKLKQFQTQQTKVNETLWDDQNHLTDALNHNNKKLVQKYQNQYFKDRLIALPIANQIDMLTIQIAKFTQDLGKPTANIHSSQTLNDWIIYQTVANNNQSLNQAITPANPNDDINPSRNTNEDDDTEHTGNESDNPSSSTNTGHTSTDDGDTGHSTDGGDTGHAGGDGDAGGGGGHGE